MWNDVLTVLLVVSVISLFLGILLALFIRFFGIEEDKKTKDIRAELPGINCGACGFKGCDDYAKSLAEGKTEPNRCIPGGTDVAAAIGDILGVEVEPPSMMSAVVHCLGGCEKKAHYGGIETCRARSMFFGGPEACIYGCVGCGDCAAACNVGAISVVNGVAVVDRSICIGCGVCAAACPRGIISMAPTEAKVRVLCSNKDRGAEAKKACSNACIGCKKCEKNCPSEAIKVINNCAVIDYEKCTDCGLCKDNCPTGCIK